MDENPLPRIGTPPGAIPRSDLTGDTRPSTPQELEDALHQLATNKQAWASLPVGNKIELLSEVLDSMWSVAEPWVAESVKAKGTTDLRYSYAEEWAFVANVVRTIRLLRRSLVEIQRFGRPRIPRGLTTREDGRVVAHVFPQSLYDRLLLPGTTAEVWMQPGVTIEETRATQAQWYRQDGSQAKVTLVLGAGNASMLIPSDFLYKMFVEGSVVLLKLNPVTSYLGPWLQRAFQALIDRGFLRIAYGGVDVGELLCEHPLVDELHTTGSDKTYEAIVFGTGQAADKRKQARTPRVAKPFTCELGNVTPVIVVPGPWTEADVRAQAERIARWVAINAGFNCLTPRVVVQWAGWPARSSLNRSIGAVLADAPTRPAWYPGAEERHAKFLEAHPEAQRYGAAARAGHLPWAFIPDLDPEDRQDVCFQNEAFCGLFAETALEAEDEADFVERAVRWANETLWGNLTATLVVHPKSLSDPVMGPVIEQAVTDLHYGMVVINQFAGLAFFAGTTTWGAYPGNASHDIQSGVGVTSNTLMFGRPEKSVVRSPFTLSPDPFRLESKRPAEAIRSLAYLQHAPSLWQATGFLYHVLRT